MTTLAELERAIDDLAVAANHLRPLMGDSPLPPEATPGDAVRRYSDAEGTPTLGFHAWTVSAAIVRAQTVWREYRAQQIDGPRDAAVDSAPT